MTPAATETPRLRIAFLCRPTSAGVWTPRSLDTGTGGSEEACIHVAEILGQRGHSVSVHMPDMVSGQRFGSVTYDNVDALKGEVIDVAIVWALPWLAALPEASTFRAGRTYLWLHTTKQSGYALEYSHLYHKIIVPSAYLRNHLHDLPDDRVLVFTNGIDPGQFDNSQQDRDPHLIAYGSDYSRGLETLLRCWPTLKKRVPDCRLNVFYGWQAQEAETPSTRNRYACNSIRCCPSPTYRTWAASANLPLPNSTCAPASGRIRRGHRKRAASLASKHKPVAPYPP